MKTGRTATYVLSALIALSSFWNLALAQSQQLTVADPESVGMSQSRLARIDTAVATEIGKKQLPGAVVLVGRQGRIVWRQAYGNRALEPAPEGISIDTIYDLASLTKVVATATSIMILVERGMIRMGDPVSRYIPEFAASGKRHPGVAKQIQSKQVVRRQRSK